MLSACTWPAARAAEALEVLARAAHLASGPREAARGVPRESPALALAQAAAGLGLEAEPVAVNYGDVPRLLRRAAPAMLVVTVDGESRLLAVVRSRGDRVMVIGPELERQAIPVSEVHAALTHELTAPLIGEVDALLASAAVPRSRVAGAREILLRERLAQARVSACHLLRTPAGGSAWQLVREARLLWRLMALLALHALEYGLWIASWWMIGRGALEGRLDPGWIGAWALLIATMIPLHLALTSVSGLLAIDAGALLKRRLLRGALSVDADRMRQDGIGRLLSRVIESEAVESLAISGGVSSLVAAVEILMSLAVLAWGASNMVLTVALVAWLGVTAVCAERVRRRRQAWTRARLDLTHDLVEKMSGHRTRLAQESPDRWHQSEDQALERYQQLSIDVDRAERTLVAVIPRGWLVLGLILLSLTLVPGGLSGAALAVTLGVLLLSSRALRSLVQGLSDLMAALLAWQQVAPLFHAARESSLPALPWQRDARDAAASREPVLVARDLSYRYRDGVPVFAGVSLVIQPGDRVLLEGASGGGKSTLCALLNGTRRPTSGLLLLHGLDLPSVGESHWRASIAAAPQFHENHVLANTLAFNLLMGKAWPPSEADLAQAEAVCRELDLAPLLARMPSGLQQIVGETGWQLSHGEKSRVYIARALLQRAEVVLLDESFAALDPTTMRRVLDCVLARANTLLVVAHP